MAREVADWIRVAREAGWAVETTARNHLRFKAPDGKVVHIGSARGAMNGRTLANAKAELRRGGLRFPEDEARKRRYGVEGILHPRAVVEVPAIVRADALLSEWDEAEFIRQHARAHPEDMIPLEAIYDEKLAREGPCGEEVEVDVQPVSTKKEDVVMVQPPTNNPPPAKTADASQERALLIRFGKQAGVVGKAEGLTSFVELLEQAILLELTVEEILEALK